MRATAAAGGDDQGDEASYRKGQGAEPFNEVAEATLTADGEQTVLVIEVRGMPLDKAFAYGRGGRSTPRTSPPTSRAQPDDVEERWTALVRPIRTSHEGEPR